MNENINFFIDVGVNIGQTLMKVKSIDKDILYVGFEPNPNCVNYVNKFIEVNHIENCTIYPVGLSEKIGFETLYADNEVASGATMLKDFRINYQTPSPTNCPCTLLEISLRV